MNRRCAFPTSVVEIRFEESHKIKRDNSSILSWMPVVACCALICALLWGSAFPALKTGFSILRIENSTGGKLHFAAFRFFIAGLMVFTGILLSGGTIRLPRRNDILIVLLLGFLQVTLQYIFFYIGLSNTTGVKAAIIASSGSFFIALFSHFWIMGDRLSVRKIVGLAIGFTGVVLVNLQKRSFDWHFSLYGEGFIILAVFAGAIGAIIVKKNAVRIHPPLLSAYQLTLGSAILFVFALSFEPPTVLHLTPTAGLLLLYLSFVSAAAFSLWYVLIKYNHLTRIAVYRFMIPVCGTLLSAAFITSESLTIIVLISLGLVSSGIVLTSR